MNKALLLSSHPARMRAGSRGAALIVVLSFIVLLTLLIVAFLLHSQMSLQITNARAAQTQVDVMARTAIEFTKGDLRQEIIAGSTNNASVYTTNGVSVYIPGTNATIVPSRTGFTPGTAGSDPMDNIVKISKSGTNFFSGSSYNASYPAANYASAVSTGTASLNGRHIDSPSTGWTTTGWDKPQLVDTTKYGTTALQSIPVPDWIYVTTSGRQVLSQPASNVVGRYAYVIYDEGGLMDINVAGYPSSMASPDARDPYRKGPIALADLTQLPRGITSTMQDSLVAWRNAATSASGAFASTNYPSTNAPPYLKYVLNGSLNRGFTTAYPGDQKFLSRQELLAYSQANPTILPAQTLAYLATFTRGLNAPTWTPPTTIATTNNASGFPYPTYAETTGAYNADSANCRWTSTFTVTRPKLDADIDPAATTVPIETVTFNQGDPVLQHRFPLSKLALLSNPAAQTGVITAPAAGATSGSVAWAVYYYFGLQWVTSDSTLSEPHWSYANGNSATLANALAISSISSVASKKREPDFFELLRQGVLRGSAQDLMIFDMGASIIDQFDADDVPTAITDGGSGPAREAFGKENLPYFSQMLVWPYRPTTDTTRTRFEGYLIPMFWNPHRNASTPSSTVTQFQMILTPPAGNSIVLSLNLPATAGVPTSGLTSAATLQFQTSSSKTYQEPTILSGVPFAPTGGEGANEVTDRSGFYLGFVDQADVNVAKALGGSGAGLSAWEKANVLMTGKNTLVMQCFYNGSWHTYENLPAFPGATGSWATLQTAGANGVSASPSFSGLAAGASATAYGSISAGPLDPRVSAGADLVGGSTAGGSGGIAEMALWTTSLGAPPYTGGTWQPIAPESTSTGYPDLGTINSQFAVYPQVNNSSILTVPSPNNLYLGMWNENKSGAGYPNYLDYDTMWQGMTGDFVSRPGDGSYGANPMAAGQIADRPIILNRPFRNVAELGYAYRGVEWRTIDFCSTVSGDAGLLDLFSVGDSQKLTALTSSTSSSTALASGVVSINTRHPEVLQSLLSGSLENDLDTTASSVISSSQAGAIADAIVAETSSTASGHGPLINRSELVTRIMGLTPVMTQLAGTVSKPQREAVVRALAEPADTRTWNLLIDLDVQVGHYPTNVVQAGSAADLSKFYVQGERRYWLHLAIDRYTSKIIDEQLEVVNDN